MKFSIFSFQFSRKLKGLPRINALATGTRGIREQVSSEQGQSLFEVIVALGIAALVLVGAISLSTATVRNSGFARNDSVATKYAQQATEWLREQRDTNWTNLSSRVGGTKCIQEPVNWGGSGMCSIGTPFTRGVQLTSVASNQIDALVIVEWTDGQGTHEVRNATTFTKWR